MENETYLTVDELINRIRYKKQTIYNMIYRGEFSLGKHYLKPSPKKILFKWTAILEWLGESKDEHSYNGNGLDCPNNEKEKATYTSTHTEGCRIKI